MKTPSSSPGAGVPLAQVLAAAAADLRREQAPPLRARLTVAGSTPAPARAPTAAPAAAADALARPWWQPRPLAWSGAFACVLVLVGAGWLMALGGGPNGVVGGLPALAAEVELHSGFVPVAPPERWQVDADGEPEPAWLVRTELPAERLAALGLPFDPGRAAAPLRAELLMHASGEVLAVRVLR